MLDNVIDKNIMFLKKHGVNINNNDDKAVYKYGLQILYYYIMDLVVIFLLAFIFGRLYETFLMTFIFGLLQIFGGGYHAKTPLKCLLMMIVGIFFGNLLIILIADKIILNIMIAAIFSGIIFIAKPVVNKNRPVSRKIMNRSKLIVQVIIILIFMVMIILIYFNKNMEIAVMTATLGLYLLSWSITKIRKN